MPMNVMLDLETLGHAPGCTILSIGAVAFDKDTIHAQFALAIDARSCERVGLRIEADTFMWWLAQSRDAQEALLRSESVALTDALVRFAIWFKRVARPVVMWTKGPSFDAAILAAAYRATGLDTPWHFRDERCVRTALDMMGVDPRAFGDPDRVRHDALGDALAQTAAVQQALRLAAHVG